MSNWKNTPRWALYKNNKRLSRKHRAYKLKTKNSYTNRLVIKAPRKFSLLDNRNETIAYINNIFSKAKQGIFLQMDMGKIDYTDPLTVTLVIALMMDARIESIKRLKYISVKIPDEDTVSGHIFKDCHFRETVLTGNADLNYFMSRTSSQVNQTYTEQIIKFAQSRGILDATSILNPLLVEIFSNTNNHATPLDESSVVPWFLSVVEKDDRLCFSVIDLGIGIYESLRSSNAIQNIPSQEFNVLVDMYDNEQSRYLSQTIPKGVYSSTRLNFRGKGLKTIYKKANDSTTCIKFDIISNRAMVDVLNINKIQQDSGESLDGTAFYWEMEK